MITMRDLSSLEPLWAPIVAWVPSDLTSVNSVNFESLNVDKYDQRNHFVGMMQYEQGLTQAKPDAVVQSWQAGRPRGAEREVREPKI